MVSRMLGYVRDFFIADAFGPGLAADAFFIAFRIPNLLRRLFAEGAFAPAFDRRPFLDTKSLIDARLDSRPSNHHADENAFIE